MDGSQHSAKQNKGIENCKKSFFALENVKPLKLCFTTLFALLYYLIFVILLSPIRIKFVILELGTKTNRLLIQFLLQSPPSSQHIRLN